MGDVTARHSTEADLTSECVALNYQNLPPQIDLIGDQRLIVGQPWSGYVEALTGESKLEAAVHAFAGTLGASPREANQFIEILNATSDVLDGADVDALEEALAVELEMMEGEDNVQPYAHLEDTSRDERLEHEHRMQTPHPSRPEPPHRAEDDEQ